VDRKEKTSNMWICANIDQKINKICKPYENDSSALRQRNQKKKEDFHL
jgi:hypothetical protein